MLIPKIESYYKYPLFTYDFGSYFSSESSIHGYIHIPKNASTYTKNIFRSGLNFKTVKNYYVSPAEGTLLVIVRDPVERWVSGISEYFWSQHLSIDIDNKTLLKFITERIVFDEHTEPQVNFLSGLDTDQLTFIRLDNKFKSNLEHFISEILKMKNWRWKLGQNEPNTILDLSPNISSAHDIKSRNVDILKNYLETNISIKEHIKNYYSKDYELFENINYYGK